jgi:ABC-2 type transport system ATP-binding protein
MLEIDHLRKVYGTGKKAKTAVEDISLSIKKGEFFGLLGPNGAGKSTTISCITGTANITSGTIAVGGYDVVTDYRTARTKVGITPQEFNVDVFERVELLMDYMGGFYGVPNPERGDRIEELIEKFELGEHRKKKFMELSGGLKRRVILARTLIHNPDLLILDEPSAGIDVEQRRALWEYLRELNAEGKTIILTSHYLEEVEYLCDRIAIINKGRIVADAPKSEFVKDGSSLEEQYLKITKSE